MFKEDTCLKQIFNLTHYIPIDMFLGIYMKKLEVNSTFKAF